MSAPKLIESKWMKEFLQNHYDYLRRIFGREEDLIAKDYARLDAIRFCMKAIDIAPAAETKPEISTRCRACPNYHAYTNAKQGRGLCTHFMHKMPEDGFCSESGKDDDDEK